MKIAYPALAALFIVSACSSTSTPRPTAQKPVPIPVAGLEHVMGKDRAALIRMFGEPDLDIREGIARKYQFAMPPLCVLDVYLYPQTPGATPVVTHVDARTLKGDDYDRASCVAALSRRKPSRPAA